MYGSVFTSIESKLRSKAGAASEDLTGLLEILPCMLASLRELSPTKTKPTQHRLIQFARTTPS